MSIEAMYSIEFAAPSGDGNTWFGGGVIIMDTDRIFGGDHHYAYVGNYELTGLNLTAEVRAFVHSRLIDTRSIFDTDENEFRVVLEGTADPSFEVLEIRGHRKDAPSRIMVARATRIAELP